MRISDWSSDVCSSDLRVGPMVFAWLSGIVAVGQRRFPAGLSPDEAVQRGSMLAQPGPRRAGIVPQYPLVRRVEGGAMVHVQQMRQFMRDRKSTRLNSSH